MGCEAAASLTEVAPPDGESANLVGEGSGLKGIASSVDAKSLDAIATATAGKTETAAVAQAGDPHEELMLAPTQVMKTGGDCCRYGEAAWPEQVSRDPVHSWQVTTPGLATIPEELMFEICEGCKFRPEQCACN